MRRTNSTLGSGHVVTIPLFQECDLRSHPEQFQPFVDSSDRTSGSPGTYEFVFLASVPPPVHPSHRTGHHRVEDGGRKHLGMPRTSEHGPNVSDGHVLHHLFPVCRVFIGIVFLHSPLSFTTTPHPTLSGWGGGSLCSIAYFGCVLYNVGQEEDRPWYSCCQVGWFFGSESCVVWEAMSASWA